MARSAKDKENNYKYQLVRVDESGKEFIKNFYITGSDTNYIDDNDGDSLKIGTKYIYKVEAYNSSNELKDTSNSLYTSTLSVTSNDIVWEIDTLGQPGNFLYDVWGTDENNVWAVGGINLPEGGTAIIKWDGKSWNYHSWPEGALYSIFGFSNNDIWVVGEWANRGFLGHFDGSNWTEYKSDYFYARGDTVYLLYAVWGSSPEDVWAVGKEGTIIHWDGNEWRKIDIGITTPITDIWGVSKNEVYLIAYDNKITSTSAVYKYDGTNWVKLIVIGIYNYSGTTVWKSPAGNLLIGGRILLEFADNDFNEIYIPESKGYILKIRGTNINNIFTVGRFGEINHFDGVNWKNIEDFEVQNGSYRVLRSVWCSKQKVFIVGADGNRDRAIVISGTINNN